MYTSQIIRQLTQSWDAHGDLPVLIEATSSGSKGPVTLRGIALGFMLDGTPVLIMSDQQEG